MIVNLSGLKACHMCDNCVEIKQLFLLDAFTLPFSVQIRLINFLYVNCLVYYNFSIVEFIFFHSVKHLNSSSVTTFFSISLSSLNYFSVSQLPTSNNNLASSPPPNGYHSPRSDSPTSSVLVLPSGVSIQVKGINPIYVFRSVMYILKVV